MYNDQKFTAVCIFKLQNLWLCETFADPDSQRNETMKPTGWKQHILAILGNMPLSFLLDIL